MSFRTATNFGSRVHLGPNSPVVDFPVAQSNSNGTELYDSNWLREFKHHLSVDIVSSSMHCCQFDIMGIDAPIANALRRVLLSEVPTMAFERVIIFQNTSIIADEVLAHRLGLIPIHADPRRFRYHWEDNVTNGLCTQDKEKSKEPVEHDFNTLVFALDVECKRVPSAASSSSNDVKYRDSTIYSRQLTWSPQGHQLYRFSSPGQQIEPYYKDIILAKLRPGQKIEVELHAEKGIGATHAKWSPVATASYRLMPTIEFKKPIKGKLARELKKKCPLNVFDLKNKTGKIIEIENFESKSDDSHEDDKDIEAIVGAPRNCSMCRECTRGSTPVRTKGKDEEVPWNSLVELSRERDHFVYKVETLGHYSPFDVVKEALIVLRQKALFLKSHIPGGSQSPDTHMEYKSNK